jgi:hypothetical protein
MNRFEKGDKICAQDGTPAGTAVEYLGDGGLVIENVHGVRVVVKGDGAYKLYTPPEGARNVNGKLTFRPIPIVESGCGAYRRGGSTKGPLGILVAEFADSDAPAADVTEAVRSFADQWSIAVNLPKKDGAFLSGWGRMQSAASSWNKDMSEFAGFKIRTGVTYDGRFTIWKE